MSIEQAHKHRVFDDAATDEQRARVYVDSGELGVKPRAERALMNAVTSKERARVQLAGPSGAGKTSLILRVSRDLADRALPEAHEVLILRIGDSPSSLTSPDKVMKLVLDTIAANGHRFANVDPGVLNDAAADRRTQHPRRANRQAGVDLRVANYSAKVEKAYRTAEFGQNPARLRHDLEDILGQIRQEHRPVLVIDDTEKFVSPGPDGQVEVDSIANLYHHGVRVLGELDLDLIVAMHPRFESVDRLREVSERIGMTKIEVPVLPIDESEPAMRRILKRRWDRSAVPGELDDVIAPETIGHLQVLYYERNHDLRSVLKLAHLATGHAVDRGSARIEPRDIFKAVAG